MSADHRTGGSRIGHHQHLADDIRPPSALAPQQARHDPPFAAHCGVQVLLIDYLTLDLDQNQGSAAGMPADQVDRTSLTKVVERVLDKHRPAIETQECRNRFDDVRVGGVQKPRKLPTPPGRAYLQPDLQSVRDLAQHAQRQLVQSTALGH
jgi:hypothetical protein